MDKMDKKSLRPNRKPGNSNRKGIKNAGFIALMVLFALIIFSALSQSPKLEKIPITTAVQQANAGQYERDESPDCKSFHSCLLVDTKGSGSSDLRRSAGIRHVNTGAL